MAEEWVRKARDEVKAEAHSRLKAEKALGAVKQEQAEFSERLKEAIQARQSAEVGLKTTERQAEDMCKSYT